MNRLETVFYMVDGNQVYNAQIILSDVKITNLSRRHIPSMARLESQLLFKNQCVSTALHYSHTGFLKVNPHALGESWLSKGGREV